MCVIIVKEKGLDLPPIELFESCWKSNKDGAGLMFSEDNKVFIRKGFMTFESFINNLNYLNERYNLKEKNVVFHFRISTSGLIDGGNCHPYPITNEDEFLRKETCFSNFGVAHNGDYFNERVDKLAKKSVGII